jgi:hypothetical protein
VQETGVALFFPLVSGQVQQQAQWLPLFIRPPDKYQRNLLVEMEAFSLKMMERSAAIRTILLVKLTGNRRGQMPRKRSMVEELIETIFVTALITKTLTKMASWATSEVSRSMETWTIASLS